MKKKDILCIFAIVTKFAIKLDEPIVFTLYLKVQSLENYFSKKKYCVMCKQPSKNNFYKRKNFDSLILFCEQ